MAGVQKVSVDSVPANALGDLQALISSNNKEYVVMGSSYYALYPTPAIHLLGFISEFIEIIELVRREKINNLQKQKEAIEREGGRVPWSDIDLEVSVGVTFQDIIMSQTGLTRIKDVLTKLLGGVDDADFNDMSLGQLSLVMDKIIKVNLDTLPDSFRKVFEGVAKQMTGIDVSVKEPPAEEDTSGNP